MNEQDKPILTYVTQRMAYDETHMECRFSDGQKLVAVTVSDILPTQITEQIYELLRLHSKGKTEVQQT